MSDALGHDDTCQLSGQQLQQRLNTIAALSRRFLVDEQQQGSTLRLTYEAAAAPELATLVQAEKECCGFLDFQVSQAAGYVHLTITAPSGRRDFERELFDHFRGHAQPKAGCGSTACGCA